jgi:hypothetical protein
MSSTTQDQLLRFFKAAAGTTVSERPAAVSSEAPSLKTDSGASQNHSNTSASALSAAAGLTNDGGVNQSYSTARTSVSSKASGLANDNADQSYSATPMGTSVAGGAESTQSTGGTGATIESALTTFMEGGLGIVPLVSGLMGLFGGGSTAPPKLEKYEQPSSIDFVSADTPSGLAAADYDQLGMPRLAETALPTSTVTSSSPASSPGIGDSSTPGNGANVGQGGAAMPQMTLNIQALDAQSILDRSSDIAQAVRSAMLNMSSINDVIGDL